MAQPVVSRFRRAALAVKTEAAYGTDILPIAADILEVSNPAFQAVQEVSRDERISGAGIDLPDIPGSRLATFSGELTLHGSGSAYAAGVKPEADALLRALGFTATGTFGAGVETWVYKRATGATFGESVTAKLYVENGPQGVLLGAFGTGRILHRRGLPTRLAFALTGRYIKPVEVALLSASPSAIQPPVFHSAAVTIGGVLHEVESLDVDLGSDVQAISAANSANGYRGVHIAGRRPTMRLDPEVVPVATFDWYDKRDLQTLMVGAWQTGTLQYNRILETAAAIKVAAIDDGERNGLRVHNITAGLNIGAIVANQSDEYVITFS
jgi:hypothetical protein